MVTLSAYITSDSLFKNRISIAPRLFYPHRQTQEHMRLGQSVHLILISPIAIVHCNNISILDEIFYRSIQYLNEINIQSVYWEGTGESYSMSGNYHRIIKSPIPATPYSKKVSRIQSVCKSTFSTSIFLIDLYGPIAIHK